MKLVKTSFFAAIVSLIRISSGFIAGKVIAMYTGPSGIAIIGQFSNFVAIALTASNGAISTGVVKYTAEYEKNEIKTQKLFGTALKISIYCSVFGGSILLLFPHNISLWILRSSLYTDVIRTFGITLIFYSLNSLLISILNGKKLIKQYTIVNTVGSIFSLIFSVVLVHFYRVQGALYSIVLSQSVIFFVTLFFVRRSHFLNWKLINKSIDLSMSKRLLGYSLMALVSVFTAPVIQMLLRDMIITKVSLSAAGYWQGMMRISDGFLLIITTALSTYYLPKLSSLKEDKDLKIEIFYGYKMILPVVCLGCFLVYFCRAFIIRILYTNAFIDMEELFLFQLLGDFFKVSAWIIAYLMLAKAMTKLFIITEIVFSLIYLILGYMLVEYIGIKGITLAFFINYFLYFIYMIYRFRILIFH